MVRPFKLRKVCCSPGVDYFKPRGIPLQILEEVKLTMDEFEAIRLADLDGLYQETAARKMNISRQTFGNIIAAAHKKIADFLVNGKSLRIEGGIIKFAVKTPQCKRRAKLNIEYLYGNCCKHRTVLKPKEGK